MGFLKRTSDPNIVDCTKTPTEPVCSCDVYLIDTATQKILPNRRYRIIGSPSGKNVLGVSDAQGKISVKFKYAYVEVLPEIGRDYLDSAITQAVTKMSSQNLDDIIEVNVNLLLPATSTTITSTTAPLPIPIGVNHLYMNWLDSIVGGVWAEYQNAVVNHFSNPNYSSVVISGVPSIPIDSRLVTVKKLMNNFEYSQVANISDYKFLNTLEHSPVTTDQHIHNCFMNVINSRRLSPQYFYVLGHGNPDVLAGYLSTGAAVTYRKNNPTELLDLLDRMKVSGYANGQTVVFLACHLGNDSGSFAEEFSKLADVATVYAFTGFGWFGTPFWCAAGYDLTLISPPSTEGIPSGTIGHWRIFNTATAAL